MSEAVTPEPTPAAPAAAPAAPAPAAAAPAPAAAPAVAPATPAPAPVPADYALTLPEGVSFDDASLAEMKAAFKAAGLTQEQAQERASGFATALKTVNDRNAQAARAAGAAALRADPEFGGEHFEKTLADAKAAAVALGGDALLAELDSTGLGNSPAIVKMFARLAREGVAGGKFVAGGHARNAEQSLPSLLYGGK